MGTLRLVIDAGRLRWAEGIAEARALEAELEGFRVKIGRALTERFEHREGAHDDLLLALATACWVAEVGVMGAAVGQWWSSF